MTSYRYTAKNMEGTTVKGSIDAQNENEVVGELRKKNLIIMGISEEASRKKGGGFSLKSSAKPGKHKKFRMDALRCRSARICPVQGLHILTGAVQ